MSNEKSSKDVRANQDEAVSDVNDIMGYIQASVDGLFTIDELSKLNKWKP